MESVNFMTKFARGLICAPISAQLADRLQLTEMVAQNTDTFKTAFTISVDHRSTTTGISAEERARERSEHWLILKLRKRTFKTRSYFPVDRKNRRGAGKKGPYRGFIDLAKLTNQSEAAYICEILNEDGTMARRPQLAQFAENGSCR